MKLTLGILRGRGGISVLCDEGEPLFQELVLPDQP